MITRRSGPADRAQLIGLVAAFRASMSRLTSKGSPASPERAAQELDEYEAKGYPLFVAEGEHGRLVGYLVCRVDGNTVWAESLFVVPECRRQGVGSELYSQAERLASDLGSSTVYNWVHPQNRTIVAFLKGRGYDVLNLIELRRGGSGEKLDRTIIVGSDEFRH